LSCLALGVLASLAAGCASAPSGPALAPVSLAQSCARGPFCVTGQIDDQFALPVGDARCYVRGDDGQIIEGRSDQRGVFLLDGLMALPQQIGFEKPGYEPQSVRVLSGGAGIPARAYVTLSRN
jgi:hypothetical protein